MGILNAIKGQLIDVIEWSDNSSKTMVHKYDMNGKEIMMGAQLTVRESQVAIFVNEGELADVFEPGRYELQTSNMPILTALKSWKYGFNSPFKAEVYFVNTKQFLDQKWGTSNPVMMRDAEFGMVRLRAFGIYSFRVVDASAFLIHKDKLGNPSVLPVDRLQILHKPQGLFRIRKILPEQENASKVIPGNQSPDFIVQFRNLQDRRFLCRRFPVFRFRHFLPGPEGRNHHLGDLLPERHPGKHTFRRIAPAVFRKGTAGKQHGNRQHEAKKLHQSVPPLYTNTIRLQILYPQDLQAGKNRFRMDTAAFCSSVCRLFYCSFPH